MNTEEQETIAQIRDTVFKVSEEFPGTYWQEKDRERAYPTEFVNRLTELGLLASLIPEEYGGSGLSITVGAEILKAIHEFGGNAGACHAQMYTMGTVLRHGSDEQKQKYLPKIANGDLRLQAFGVTEPTAGTDTTSISTMAVKKGDKYVINGQKIWTSRAEHSDLMVLLARTTPKEQVEKKSAGLSVFLVDMRDAINKGMTIKPIRTMLNHSTTEIFFDDLEIPASSLIGEEGKGFKYILSGMNAERILIAAECVGDARYFIKKASDYSNERQVFGRPIGQNQGIQFPIARAFAQTEAAEAILDKACRLYEEGDVSGTYANMAKLLTSEASWAAADTCMQTFGGFAVAEEYDIERKFRETRLYQIAPISTNLILSYLAEHELGLPRSY
ncbi:MAG: acyl-CoA/acyl-ACP dehydrogenase [Proteobacteria bacterium]|jgi:acyl-CoA dehydrogenase|nr:acyl-CoA/acyl-ACP dehydrogenase [Pseudomonadota bacterium]MBT6464565.1 acyl-CoA/acyl-ACP dehydrogenase [Pseudomonadota bacterium]MBT6674112.1 acyl-CoA/acyl-ACP dehydrogenase [Pseudomonadota bacterium]